MSIERGRASSSGARAPRSSASTSASSTPVDTDLTAPLEVEKIPPATVAASALDALQAGEPEALVDDFSRAVKSGMSDDQRALYPQVERGSWRWRYRSPTRSGITKSLLKRF